jgi:hypothetical protein
MGGCSTRGMANSIAVCKNILNAADLQSRKFDSVWKTEATTSLWQRWTADGSTEIPPESNRNRQICNCFSQGVNIMLD